MTFVGEQHPLKVRTMCTYFRIVNVLDRSVGRSVHDRLMCSFGRSSSGPPPEVMDGLVGGCGDKTMLFYCIHPSSRGLDGVMVVCSFLVLYHPSRPG